MILIEQGYIVYEPTPEISNNPNDVFISVLTNTISYSSATMFGVWIQDGDFGNIIGEPSRNAPSAFGNSTGDIFLPESQIHFSVSTNRWLRPDIEANQGLLVPDIWVDSEDALDVAIDFLNALQSE